MKIKFDIEVTPQELRAFLGLPDVEPLQQELITGNSYRDSNINTGKEYFYTLTVIDTHGNESPAVQATVTTR